MNYFISGVGILVAIFFVITMIKYARFIHNYPKQKDEEMRGQGRSLSENSDEGDHPEPGK